MLPLRNAYPFHIPVNPRTKFTEPSGLTGEWTTTHSTCFWHASSPLSVKFAIEKLTANLFKHEPNSPESLTYICPNAGPLGGIFITLRLEAVFPTQHLYSLHTAFKDSRNWVTEKDFLEKSLATFNYWCSKLKLPDEEIPWAQASPLLLEQEILSTLAAEQEATARKEDPIAIATLQQEILAAIRAGYMFFSSDKEGTTRIYHNGHKFFRRREGDDSGTITYAAEAEFLTALRNYHDWEARRDTYPHSPPELQIWQFIQSRLTR